MLGGELVSERAPPGEGLRDPGGGSAEPEQKAQQDQRLGWLEQPGGDGTGSAQILAAAVAVAGHYGTGFHAGARHHHDAGRGGVGDFLAQHAVCVARSRPLEHDPCRPGLRAARRRVASAPG